jgi:hypothetical protein
MLGLAVGALALVGWTFASSAPQLRIVSTRCGSFVVQAIGNRGSRAMIDRTGLDRAPID